jgi:hypothetical protein
VGRKDKKERHKAETQSTKGVAMFHKGRRRRGENDSPGVRDRVGQAGTKDQAERHQHIYAVRNCGRIAKTVETSIEEYRRVV